MEDEELLDVFLEEFDRNVQRLDENLVTFEKQGTETALDELFRSTHTIKSSAASMEFEDLSELAHKMEDIFDKLKDDEIESDKDLFNLLYKGVDTMKEAYDEIEETGERPDLEISDLIENLEKVEKGEEIEGVDADMDFGEETEIEDISVDADTLDNLMNAAGELAIIQKKLRELLSPIEDTEVEKTMSQFKRLSHDIRSDITRARMVPVSQMFEEFNRTVRDLENRTGKQIDFELETNELRLDRAVLREIREPVIHLLRNAVDHGIENPEERKQAGKNITGHITLKAQRDGEEAVVAVQDDGKGIDSDRVKSRAIEEGVVSSEELEEMGEQEVVELICDSSLSTNEEVDEVSGRGVGMNIVKESIEKLQGTYRIETEKGEGTTINLRFPVSLAIVKCFVIEAGEQKFGIPLNAIEHVTELGKDDIKSIEGEEVFVYNDREIPLKDLKKRYGGHDDEGDSSTIVIVNIGKKKAGIKIGEVLRVEEFVIKDIDFIKQEGIAGSSILPDGTPFPILDIGKILRDM